MHTNSPDVLYCDGGGVLYGGRGTVLLLGRRTPAEHLRGVSNHGPEADVGDIFAWLR